MSVDIVIQQGPTLVIEAGYAAYCVEWLWISKSPLEECSGC